MILSNARYACSEKTIQLDRPVAVHSWRVDPVLPVPTGWRGWSGAFESATSDAFCSAAVVWLGSAGLDGAGGLCEYACAERMITTNVVSVKSPGTEPKKKYSPSAVTTMARMPRTDRT